jgi:hypothetical protein
VYNLISVFASIGFILVLLFVGICDNGLKGGVTSPAACCKTCSDKPSCKAFVFYSSKCFLKDCQGGLKKGITLADAWSAYRNK